MPAIVSIDSEYDCVTLTNKPVVEYPPLNSGNVPPLLPVKCSIGKDCCSVDEMYIF